MLPHIAVIVSSEKPLEGGGTEGELGPRKVSSGSSSRRDGAVLFRWERARGNEREEQEREGERVRGQRREGKQEPVEGGKGWQLCGFMRMLLRKEGRLEGLGWYGGRGGESKLVRKSVWDAVVSCKTVRKKKSVSIVSCATVRKSVLGCIGGRGGEMCSRLYCLLYHCEKECVGFY